MIGYVLWSLPLLAVGVAGAFGMWWFFDHQNDGLALVSLLVGLFAAICALCILAVPTTSLQSCTAQGDAMDRDSRYGVWTGCLIRTTDGRWVPLDAYRLTDDENPPTSGESQ